MYIRGGGGGVYFRGEWQDRSLGREEVRGRRRELIMVWMCGAVVVVVECR